MAPHTFRVFDDDLERLRLRVLELGDRTMRQVVRGVDSVLRGDVALAREVIARDGELDALQRDVDDSVTAVLVRQHAVASDLREVLAAGRIAIHLERCGDHAKAAARRGAALSLPLPAPVAAQISRMGTRIGTMLRAALEAYTARDAAAAAAAWASDDELDALYDQLLRAIVRDMRASASTLEDGAELLLIAKGLERMGDHSADVAEEVHLMVTGARITRLTEPSRTC